jgi:hypothetical protein
LKRKQNNIPVATFNRIATQTGSKDTHSSRHRHDFRVVLHGAIA